MLDTLSRLPGDAANEVQLADWMKLAGILPTGSMACPPATSRTAAQTDELFSLFYTGKTDDPTRVRVRRPGLLAAVDDKTYDDTYQYIHDHVDLQFADIHRLLRTNRDEGQIMMRVMAHVVSWLNPNPTWVANRENNKPPLRKDLVPALGQVSPHNATPAARLATRAAGPDVDVGGEADDADAGVDKRAEECSILLEHRVLEFVRDSMAAFKNPVARAYLDQFPTGRDDADYAERFSDDFWSRLLDMVCDVAGPRLGATWRALASATSSTTPGRQGGQDAPTHKAPSAITRALCTLLPQVPDVVRNPALNNKVASAELGAAIDEAVVGWVVRRCRLGLDSQVGEREPWSVETRELVRSTQEKYDLLARQHQPSPEGKDEGGGAAPRPGSPGRQHTPGPRHAGDGGAGDGGVGDEGADLDGHAEAGRQDGGNRPSEVGREGDQRPGSGSRTEAMGDGDGRAPRLGRILSTLRPEPAALPTHPSKISGRKTVSAHLRRGRSWRDGVRAVSRSS